jgi:hypothetical protein
MGSWRVTSLPYETEKIKRGKKVNAPKAPSKVRLQKAGFQSVVYFTTLSVPKLYSVKWQDESEQSDLGLIETIPRHLPGGTEEYHEPRSE